MKGMLNNALATRIVNRIIYEVTIVGSNYNYFCIIVGPCTYICTYCTIPHHTIYVYIIHDMYIYIYM